MSGKSHQPSSVSSTQAKQALAVARLNSFSKAAVELRSSQSSVSNAVAALEGQLGLSLFVRSTRKVVPTKAFLALKKHLERLVTATEAVEGASQQLRGIREGQLRVGISPVVDTDRVEGTLRSFERAHPDTSVELIELNLRDLISDLDLGRLHVVVAPFDEKRGRFRSFRLYEEPLLLLRERGAGVTGAPTPLKTVGDEVFLMVPDICGLALATTNLFKSEKLKLRRSKTQALGYHLLERGALHGRGLAILPRSKISREAIASEIVLSSGVQAALAVHVVQRREGRLSAIQKALVDAFRTDLTYSMSK